MLRNIEADEVPVDEGNLHLVCLRGVQFFYVLVVFLKFLAVAIGERFVNLGEGRFVGILQCFLRALVVESRLQFVLLTS